MPLSHSPQVPRVLLAVKADETSCPVDVSLLGVQAVMPNAQRFTHLIEQPRRSYYGCAQGERRRHVTRQDHLLRCTDGAVEFALGIKNQMTTSPDFGRLFIESKGQPILHAGRMLVLADRIQASKGQCFTVTIEATSSSHMQGVGISEGVVIFGEKVKRGVVWEYFSLPPEQRSKQRASLPFSFEVECANSKGWLSFYNMAEFHGRQEWWHGGSCMWVEEIPGGRRYHCNDFELNEDFNDIVFTVTSADAQPILPPDLSRQAAPGR